MSKLDEISDDVQEALEITSLVFALLAKCDMYTDEALEMAAEHLEHNVEHCEMDGYRDAAHNLLLLATIIRNGIVDSNGVPIGTNPLTNKPETAEETFEENRSKAEQTVRVRKPTRDEWMQNWAIHEASILHYVKETPQVFASFEDPGEEKGEDLGDIAMPATNREQEGAPSTEITLGNEHKGATR